MSKTTVSEIDKLICSGTGGDPGIGLMGGQALAYLKGKARKSDEPDYFINKLVFGSFNKTVAQPKTPFDWLSTDTDTVEKYINDPLCGFVPTTGLFMDLFNGLAKINDPNGIRQIPSGLPILLLSGLDDPVGAKGKGVWQAARQFIEAGIDNITVMLYEGGRHEMLQEKNRRTSICFYKGMDSKRMKQSDRVIAIVGPTASGKTSLSIELAKRLDGEIINGDAMQVYKGLDIGTAKIKEDEKEGIPHHLFDIKEPTESFSVAEYQSTVRSCIEDIRSRGKQPIIVGGTGLYIQSVLFDFRFTEEAGDEKIRAELEKELEAEGGPERLYSRLQQLDPSSAEKIHPNNYRRLIRALEIIEVTGKTKNEHEQGAGEVPIYESSDCRPFLGPGSALRKDQSKS